MSEEYHNILKGMAPESYKMIISEFVKILKGKWKYLTVHMYEMKFDPNYEEEVKSVFKELIEEYEEKLK